MWKFSVCNSQLGFIWWNPTDNNLKYEVWMYNRVIPDACARCWREKGTLYHRIWISMEIQKFGIEVRVCVQHLYFIWWHYYLPLVKSLGLGSCLEGWSFSNICKKGVFKRMVLLYLGTMLSGFSEWFTILPTTTVTITAVYVCHE